ncbi:hypothetical protein [Cellulomonas cellasea]|uniref:Uncharacterized protein n=2 Tax=Cellulomonas cellasea TaxID=43670 RepID=A0A0A0BAH1_9CELL|nr:hypothetical protein [Cellulomonas cellasea]KGM02291.1 hypothetical protein Q760_14465 [Cellulomonas cellasea DSM 20118]GEA86210.1 hypothetical protein CCE01nite_01590 [Cellulomonas cellasea]
MSTDGPTEKIPTTPAAGTAPGRTAADPTEASRTEPGTATAAYPVASSDPLSAFDRPEPAPSAPTADTPAPEAEPQREPAVRRGVRVGTFVWGLVIVAVGIGVLALSAGYELDVELALIVLLGVAGAAMLVGSLLKGRRGGPR